MDLRSGAEVEQWLTEEGKNWKAYAGDTTKEKRLPIGTNGNFETITQKSWSFIEDEYCPDGSLRFVRDKCWVCRRINVPSFESRH